MTIVSQGLGSVLLIVQGYGSSGPPSEISFREALRAKLAAIDGLSSIIGDAIYPGAVPETHDLGRDGPALVYNVIAYPRGNALASADGTASPRVQLDVYGYSLSSVDGATRAVVLAINGPPVNPWADGAPVIMSCTHHDEQDLHEPPRAGTDQWTYRIMTEYLVRHRVPLPSLS